MNVIWKIRDGKQDLTDVKNDHKNFRFYLGKIRMGGKKSKEQIKTIKNIETLYEARNEAIKLYDDYSLLMSEAKFKAKKKVTQAVKVLKY